jgi:very-short-patch-repair endonuclease/transposase-like protein
MTRAIRKLLVDVVCPDCGKLRKYSRYTIKRNLKKPYRCKKCSYPYRKKVRYWLGKNHSQETIEKIKKARAKQKPHWKGKKRSEATKKAVSEGVKKLWKDPEYRKRMSEAHKNYTKEQLRNILRRRIPSSYETKLNGILEKNFPNEWRYVGDGQLVIGGKNPDFTNINGKKALIELFGEHWHLQDEEKERIDLFTEYGYMTLIVWGKELRNPDVLIKKIRKFLERLN